MELSYVLAELPIKDRLNFANHHINKIKEASELNSVLGTLDENDRSDYAQSYYAKDSNQTQKRM